MKNRVSPIKYTGDLSREFNRLPSFTVPVALTKLVSRTIDLEVGLEQPLYCTGLPTLSPRQVVAIPDRCENHPLRENGGREVEYHPRPNTGSNRSGKSNYTYKSHGVNSSTVTEQDNPMHIRRPLSILEVFGTYPFADIVVCQSPIRALHCPGS